MAEEDRAWSHVAEELAACFTVHARDLFGYACVLSDADRQVAGDLVQATFEAAATVWCTLRDLPAGQRDDWLRDTLAGAAQRQPGQTFISPSHRRLTELKMARFRGDYDAVAGLDRFAGWLRNQAAGPAGTAARLRALTPTALSPHALSPHAGGPQPSGPHAGCMPGHGSPSNGSSANGVSPNGGTVSPHGTGAPPRPGVTVTR